jgi:pimeloyl-ACP methyl ester carboxylesterase
MIKKTLKGAAWLLAFLLLAVAGFVLGARLGWLTPDDATLRARYALPASQFVNIDGKPIHFVDEGHGDAIVLIHGSFGSLRMWNDWAKALSTRYRVIRFDRPPMGLSGPDPSGHYDVAREMQVIGGLTARLGVQRFFLVATSSAGVSGAGYAAAHAEQIRGLILSNVAVGAVKTDVDHQSPQLKRVLRIDPIFKGWHSREFWRQIMLANFYDPAKVTPAIVREWTELNNRAQRMPAAADSVSMRADLERTPHDLPRIVAPTLLLWSADDHEVTLANEAQKALALLGSKDKSLVVVPHCGHMMQLECSAESLPHATAFFDRIVAAGG